MNFQKQFIQLRTRYILNDDNWRRERDKLIEKAAAAGFTCGEIGGWLGLTRAAISDILISRGFHKREQREAENKKLGKEVVRRVKEGETVKVIAEAMGIDEHKVRILAYRNGLVPKRPSKPKDPSIDKRNERIKKDYLTGKYTYEQLGEKYGLNPVWLGRMLNLMGVIRNFSEKEAKMKARNEMIADMAKSGVAIDAICKKVNMKPQSVRNILSAVNQSK